MWIQTSAEALQQGFTFYVHEDYYDLISDERRGQKRLEFISAYDDTNLKQTLNPNFNGVILRTLIEVLHKNRESYPNFHFKIMKSPFLSVPIVFYFPKNFYLISAIDRQIQALQSSGLIEYWMYREHFDEILLKLRNPQQSPKQLEMEHLTISFKILGLGLALAFAIFVVEVFIRRCRREEER